MRQILVIRNKHNEFLTGFTITHGKVFCKWGIEDSLTFDMEDEGMLMVLIMGICVLQADRNYCELMTAEVADDSE